MTILELLVGILVAGLVMAAATPAFRAMLDGYNHRNSALSVTSRMFVTRQMAVRERRPFVVELAANGLSVFKDDDGDGVLDAGEDTFGPYEMSSGVSIQNVSWPAGRLTFFPNGAASQTADLRVVDGKGRSKVVRVSSITGNSEILP